MPEGATTAVQRRFTPEDFFQGRGGNIYIFVTHGTRTRNTDGETMTKEDKYALELKRLGIYEPAFDSTIHNLAILEREQSRTRKAWKAAAAAEDREPSTLDKHYEMILRQGKMIQDLKESLGLTPRGLRKIRNSFGVSETSQQEKPLTMLEIIREKKRAAL